MWNDPVIREVEPEEAEAVLALRLHIPRVIEGEDQFFLARTVPHRLVSETTRVAPDGRVTRVSTWSVSDGLGYRCSHVDGRTKDGRGCGHSKYVSIRGETADSVVVKLTMSWTDQDGKRGQLERKLTVPWLGATRKELPSGGWIAADMTRIGSPVAADRSADE